MPCRWARRAGRPWGAGIAGRWVWEAQAGFKTSHTPHFAPECAAVGVAGARRGQVHGDCPVAQLPLPLTLMPVFPPSHLLLTSSHTPVSLLSLQWVWQAPDVGRCMAPALRALTALQDFELSDHQLGPGGAAHLAAALAGTSVSGSGGSVESTGSSSGGGGNGDSGGSDSAGVSVGGADGGVDIAVGSSAAVSPCSADAGIGGGDGGVDIANGVSGSSAVVSPSSADVKLGGGGGEGAVVSPGGVHVSICGGACSVGSAGLRQLTRLQLSGLHMGLEGARQLAPALASLPRLATLVLSRNALGPKGAAAVCPALVVLAPTLTELDLGGNDLGLRGAAALAGVVWALRALRDLRLGGNAMGPEGAAALAPAISELAAPLPANPANPGSGGGTPGSGGGGAWAGQAALAQPQGAWPAQGAWAAAQQQQQGAWGAGLPEQQAQPLVQLAPLAPGEVTAAALYANASAFALATMGAYNSPLYDPSIDSSSAFSFQLGSVGGGSGRGCCLQRLCVEHNALGRDGIELFKRAAEELPGLKLVYTPSEMQDDGYLVVFEEDGWVAL